MLLRISSAIRNEWQVRGITDIVPAFAEIAWDVVHMIFVDVVVAKEIPADCAFQMDPLAVPRRAATERMEGPATI